MLGALALIAVLVQPGNTLSGIAASHGVSLAAVEQANPQITDPDLIYAGQSVVIPEGGSWTPSSAPSSPSSSSGSYSSSQPSASPSTSPSSDSGYQSCVIQRESGGDSQVMNSSGHYGLYQFDESTWVAGGGSASDFGHASVAEQNQVFASTYAARGSEPWSGDGC